MRVQASLYLDRLCAEDEGIFSLIGYDDPNENKKTQNAFLLQLAEGYLRENLVDWKACISLDNKTPTVESSTKASDDDMEPFDIDDDTEIHDEMYDNQDVVNRRYIRCRLRLDSKKYPNLFSLWQSTGNGVKSTLLKGIARQVAKDHAANSKNIPKALFNIASLPGGDEIILEEPSANQTPARSPYAGDIDETDAWEEVDEDSPMDSDIINDIVSLGE